MNESMMMMQPAKIMMDTPQGLEKMSHEGIFVKQEAIECVCDPQKPVQVLNLDRNGEKKGQLIYNAKEKSGCCARTYLTDHCRPFKMSVLEKDYMNDRGNESEILKFDKECSCTFLCLDRPELTVTNVMNGAEARIGKIRSIWMCMDLQVDVHDETDTLKYKINGSCCQPGLFAKCPCEPCGTIDFDIYNATGEKIGSLQKSHEKKTCKCPQYITSDPANFAAFFPAGATSNDKALLLAVIMMLDFTYFEEKPESCICCCFKIFAALAGS